MLMSAPSFRLKGSGWKKTDFKSDKEKKRNLADGKADAAAGSKSSSDGAAASATASPAPIARLSYF